jgi:ABC-2 type transport system ATP-binding protein
MIEAQALTKRYGHKLAVDELSFEVRPGILTGVRSPEIDTLRRALETNDATASIEADGSLSVRGADEVAIGELAARIPVLLHELSPQSASLEEAFTELTEESVEYHGVITASTTAPTGINP